MRTRHLLTGLIGVVAATAIAAPAPPAIYPGAEIDAALGRIAEIVFSADGRLLAAAGARGYGVWDAQTGSPIRNGPGSPALRVAFGGQGSLVAVGGDDGRVSIVDLRSGAAREIVRHARSIASLAFAPDGRLGASGDAEGGINVWDSEHGLAGPLKDGGHKRDILALAFSSSMSLLSLSRDLRVVTWDVPGKRAVRRGTLQSEISGRTVDPHAAAVDPAGTRLVVGGQLISEPRGGALTSRAGPARPDDLARDNVLIPYAADSGIAGDPIKTSDFTAEHVAVSPKACFAVFTSNFRSQPRLHVWGLIERGDDLLRADLPARASAIAIEPAGGMIALATEAGTIRTWKTSGATAADCDAFVTAKRPVTTAGPTISLGSETQPLIKSGTGSRIAILRFDATGVDPGVGDAVGEMVAGELSNNAQITVIERGAINAVLKEMEIQRSGLTAADAVKIGKGLNARKVLFGSVRRFGEATFLITARIVDVETQQVEGSREVTCEACKEGDLPRAVSVLRRTIVP
jgi:TolB-like protein